MTGKTTDETSAIRSDIERTRGDMSRTVNAIEERLSPAHLKEQIASVTEGMKADIEHKVSDLKESVLGNYHEVKDHLKDDIGREVRDAKHVVTDEISHARHAVREATVGRVEHMVHDARETVTDAGTSILDTIKANPIPAALIGVGLGWLLFGRKTSASSSRPMRSYRSGTPMLHGSDRGYGYGYDEDRDGPERGVAARVQQGAGRVAHRAEGAMHDAGERVNHLVHDAGDRVNHIAHEAGDRVNHLVHDAGQRAASLATGARDAAVHLGTDVRRSGERVVRVAGQNLHRAEQSVESTMRENPLALGAVALAVGAAIGLALPHTQIEDEWMGETKERLVERAQDVAGEALHKAEDAVGQLTAGEGGGAGSKNESRNGDALKNGISQAV